MSLKTAAVVTTTPLMTAKIAKTVETAIKAKKAVTVKSRTRNTAK